MACSTILLTQASMLLLLLLLPSCRPAAGARRRRGGDGCEPRPGGAGQQRRGGGSGAGGLGARAGMHVLNRSGGRLEHATPGLLLGPTSAGQAPIFAACDVVLPQGPYRAVGQALEVIPRTLAQNCGANVIRTLTKLRAKHAEAADCTFGIDGASCCMLGPLHGRAVCVREVQLARHACLCRQAHRLESPSCCAAIS